MSENETYFEKLNNVNVNEHTEKKNGYTYLSWSWAWSHFKQEFPNATYTKHTDENGIPAFFLPDGTAVVKVTVDTGEADLPSLTEIYPVTNYNNKAIVNPNAYDINSAFQRCFVKVMAMHGLGLYIYNGDIVPEIEKDAEQTASFTPPPPATPQPEPQPAPQPTTKVYDHNTDEDFDI